MVYGPQDDGDKALFLEELEAIRDSFTGPWAVTDDFNLILSEQDKTMTGLIGQTCATSIAPLRHLSYKTYTYMAVVLHGVMRGKCQH